MNRYGKFFAALILLFFSHISFSQRIENVDFTVSNNIVTVTYDLGNCPPKTIYDLVLKFVDESGKEIPATSITGDVKGVAPGKNKRMEWNALNDVSSLKGNIKAVVGISSSHSTKITGGPSCAFASMVLPGLGDYLVDREHSQAALYITIVYGGAVLYAIAGKKSYDKLSSEYNDLKSQSLTPGNTVSEYDLSTKKHDANSSYNTFIASTVVAATVWVADVIYVAVKGSKNKKKQLGIANNSSPVKLYFTCSRNNYGLGFIKTF